MEEVEDGSQNGKVAGNVAEASRGRASVAVGRDSVADLLDGEVGELKGVAIGIDHAGRLLRIELGRIVGHVGVEGGERG